MSKTAARYFESIKSEIAKDTDLPDFFVYHLTVELHHAAAKVQAVKDCYEACDLSPPSWLASHFSNGLKSAPKRFIKKDGGYRLENRHRDKIASILNRNPATVQTSASLNRLEALAPEGPKREFLHETIDCFAIGANRAAVVMCWNLALHHLQDHVISRCLPAFNRVLASNTDRRVKITSIAKQDDFTEMSESKFLELCRVARIITSGIFKKLENRLDERNSAAHPSGIKTTPKFAEAYIEDLVENVLRKFAV